MRNETNAVSLFCKTCNGSGVLVTRWTLGGEPLRTEACDRCHGTGQTPCCLCETAHAVTEDVDRNPLCQRCADRERAAAPKHPVLAFIDEIIAYERGAS